MVEVSVGGSPVSLRCVFSCDLCHLLIITEALSVDSTAFMPKVRLLLILGVTYLMPIPQATFEKALSLGNLCFACDFCGQYRSH